MTKPYIKSLLEGITSSVIEQEDTSLEIIGKDFPLRSYVSVFDYSIMLATFMSVTGQGFMRGSKSRFYPFLNSLNDSTIITKITVDPNSGSNATWKLRAQAMLINGLPSTQHDTKSLSNIIALWHRDIAGIVSTKGPYIFTAMLVKD